MKCQSKVQHQPMRLFHAFTEGYVSLEHTGLVCAVCIMFGSLVSGWNGCMHEEKWCMGNHSWLLSYQWMGLFVPWEQMNVQENEVLIVKNLHYVPSKEKNWVSTVSFCHCSISTIMKQSSTHLELRSYSFSFSSISERTLTF